MNLKEVVLLVLLANLATPLPLVSREEEEARSLIQELFVKSSEEFKLANPQLMLRMLEYFVKDYEHERHQRAAVLQDLESLEDSEDEEGLDDGLDEYDMEEEEEEDEEEDTEEEHEAEEEVLNEEMALERSYAAHDTNMERDRIIIDSLTTSLSLAPSMIDSVAEYRAKTAGLKVESLSDHQYDSSLEDREDSSPSNVTRRRPTLLERLGKRDRSSTAASAASDITSSLTKGQSATEASSTRNNEKSETRKGRRRRGRRQGKINREKRRKLRALRRRRTRKSPSRKTAARTAARRRRPTKRNRGRKH